MVNVLDVVVILEHIDELLHVLDVLLIGEADVVLGDHLHTGGQDGVALPFQSGNNGGKGNAGCLSAAHQRHQDRPR